MFNPETVPASTYMTSLEAAARSLKVEPIIAPIHGDAQIETAPALNNAPAGFPAAGAAIYSWPYGGIQ
jgi:hypothetical protein